MSVSLAELLPLVGRLDDAPGFDTPRERFRRFLLDRAGQLPTIQSLIDECQRSVGEQHHRVLQDLIAVVGRQLQFAIAFGTYERFSEALDTYSHWRSAGVLDVILQIETDHTPATLEPLARAVAASRAAGGEASTIGLCVVARQSAARGKLTKLAGQGQFSDVRVVSVASLLSLAAHASANRVSHAEIVELLRTSAPLDFMIDLMTRQGAGERSSDARQAEPSRPAAVDDPPPAFWVAVIDGDETVTPERWLTSVVADRHVLAVGDGDRVRDHGSPGDWVCFFLAGKGIVGHAQLAYLVEDGTNVVRHSEKFGRVYRLAHLTLYDRPVVQALRAGRPFAVPSSPALFAGSRLTPIGRQDFLALTEQDSSGA